jgi:hypothetical protein
MRNHAASLQALELSDRHLQAGRVLRSAVRQVASLRAAGAGLAHAPTLDDRVATLERAREELVLLEQSSEIYAELTGADLLTDVEPRLARLDVPGSWLEASIAQFLLCAATLIELEAQPQLPSLLDSSRLRALAWETEHVNAARAALLELDALAAAALEPARALFIRWFTIALDTLETESLRKRYVQALQDLAAPVGMLVTPPALATS